VLAIGAFSDCDLKGVESRSDWCDPVRGQNGIHTCVIVRAYIRR